MPNTTAERPLAAIEALLERHPPQVFERGETLIETTLLETTDFAPHSDPGAAPSVPGAHPLVGYVVEGLVRGMWNRNTIAPSNRATATVAGDGRWIGADAFKFGKNLFRYAALTPTSASIFPLSYMEEEAPRAVLHDALRSVSLDWCTTASVLSLGADTLARRTLLLLYDMSRLHPRPELEVRQKDIADMLGVARQTLQPILKGIETRGLIHLGYGEILIDDPADLVRRLRRKK
jgi:CRP-like cAMP-binding protein